MLLSLCEFDLNSTHSASTKQLPAFVISGQAPNLPLEVTFYDVTDYRVYAATDHITYI